MNEFNELGQFNINFMPNNVVIIQKILFGFEFLKMI